LAGFHSPPAAELDVRRLGECWSSPLSGLVFGKNAMIRECDVRRHGAVILIGIAVDAAVLDFTTTEGLLRDCLAFLESPHQGLAYMQIGAFGDFPVTLNMHHDDSLSIFVDGPDFEPQRSMSAAIWLSKEDLRGVISKALVVD
jgi:hypothetical protein